MIKKFYSGSRDNFWVNLADYVQYWVAKTKLQDSVWRERETLANLTDDELRDIGVTRYDADREARRSDADLPPQRLAQLQREFRQPVTAKDCTGSGHASTRFWL